MNYVTRAKIHLLDQAYDDNDNTLLSLREGGGFVESVDHKTNIQTVHRDIQYGTKQS